MKKYALSLLTLSMVLSSGAALAAELGEPLQQNVDITFNATSTVAHEITAVLGLPAGVLTPGTVIANGVVTTVDNVDSVRLDFTNNTGLKSSGTGYIRAAFAGRTPGNTLEVRMTGGTSVGTGSASYIRLDGPANTFAYTLNTHFNTAIAPDTYNVAVSAQRWMN